MYLFLVLPSGISIDSNCEYAESCEESFNPANPSNKTRIDSCEAPSEDISSTGSSDILPASPDSNSSGSQNSEVFLPLQPEEIPQKTSIENAQSNDLFSAAQQSTVTFPAQNSEVLSEMADSEDIGEFYLKKLL